MTIDGILRRVDALERKLIAMLGAVVEYTTLSRTTAIGDQDQANFAGNPTDRQRPVRRVAPWGVASYPPAGILAAIVKAVGGAFNGMVVGIAGDQYWPANLQEGETALYCSQGGTIVKLDKNGNVFITAASGKDVTVNGGTSKVSRVGDNVIAASSMATWISSVSTATSTTPPTSFGTIDTSGGAPHFKG